MAIGIQYLHTYTISDSPTFVPAASGFVLSASMLAHEVIVNTIPKLGRPAGMSTPPVIEPRSVEPYFLVYRRPISYSGSAT